MAAGVKAAGLGHFLDQADQETLNIPLPGQ